MTNKVEIINDDKGFHKVLIAGLLHLRFDTPILAFHSYIDEKSDGVVMYYINFHLDGGQMVHCEYNNHELWETILKGF